MNNSSFAADLGSLIIPRQKWHWWFHLAVLLVSASYWIVSLHALPPHSSAEAILYRPAGDTEYYPIINALSHFNFGDPTDAVQYGRGLASYPFVGSLPHALACLVFGKAGYLVGDMLVSWLYFLCVTLFFRACGFGNLSSLIVGSALATNALQTAVQTLGGPLGRLLATLGVPDYGNGFPGLLTLSIFEKRIPRPMVMEIILVLLLYFVVRWWRRETRPGWREGAAIGALFGLLFQGDFYSAFAVAMLTGGMIAWLILRNQGKVPWQFFLGGGLGGLLTGWIFVLQRLHENPDIPRRYGLAYYPRTDILWLPGSDSLVRVVIIGVLAFAVFHLSRARPAEPLAAGKSRPAKAPLQATPAWRGCGGGAGERSVALFFAALLLCAFFAQPVQIFLLGQGTQIYHYLLNVPVFYSYAGLVLLFLISRTMLPPRVSAVLRRLAEAPGARGAAFLACLLLLEALVTVNMSFAAVNYAGNPRHISADNEPWAAMGDSYRPNLRQLEAAFSTNSAIAATRTFAAFDIDVNVLLTTFHGKRAYNPDPFLSTLGDDEIERRLCVLAKILGLQPPQFVDFIQAYYIDCYSLGHNKYHFASDHKFSTDDDYSPGARATLAGLPEQWGWMLVIPIREVVRMTVKFMAVLGQKPDATVLPDMIILTADEKDTGMQPSAEFYEPLSVSTPAFYVYLKKVAAASPGGQLQTRQ